MREETGRARGQREESSGSEERRGLGRPAAAAFVAPGPFHPPGAEFSDMGPANTEGNCGTQALEDSSICRRVLESTAQNYRLSMIHPFKAFGEQHAITAMVGFQSSYPLASLLEELGISLFL